MPKLKRRTRQEGAVGVERELGGDLVVAAVAVGDEAAGALVGPFDRAAERARGMQHADIFRKRRRLHAERAADIAGEDADLLGLDVEDFRHVAPHAEHALRGDVQREASARGIVDADRRARLHRVHHQAAVDELEPRDVRGLGEGGGHLLGIAVVIIERDVARALVMEERRAGARGLLRPDHRGQRIDIELDRLGGVLRLQQRLGHDEGDRIADEAHLVGGQRRPRRLVHRGAVAVVERHDAFERAVAGEVGAGIDAEHARHLARGRDVDALDHAVRDAAAHDHRIGLAGELDVVGVAAGSAHQRRVLGARHRLADAEFHQGEAVRIVLQVHEAGALIEFAGGLEQPAGRSAADHPRRPVRGRAWVWFEIEDPGAFHKQAGPGHALDAKLSRGCRAAVARLLREAPSCYTDPIWIWTRSPPSSQGGFGAAGRHEMNDEGRGTGGLDAAHERAPPPRSRRGRRSPYGYPAS